MISAVQTLFGFVGERADLRGKQIKSNRGPLLFSTLQAIRGAGSRMPPRPGRLLARSRDELDRTLIRPAGPRSCRSRSP